MPVTLQAVTNYLEALAPLAYQESYDNAGLIVGEPTTEVTGVLVTLDCTEAVVAEAVRRGCNLIVAHHPIVFKGLKKLNGRTYVERTVLSAIRQNVAIYASHTNLDHVTPGVNHHLAGLLGLKNVRILSPKKGVLQKLVTFVPVEATPRVLDALYAAGAGQVGGYQNCSFRVEGTGTFRPTEGTNPAIGQEGTDEEVRENRVEVLLPAHLESRVLRALREAHPYEEVAYYLTALENANQDVGAGAIGELPEPMAEEAFFRHLQQKLKLTVVRHTPMVGRLVGRVAVCGGAGSFLLADARRQGADAFVTADFKYHEFFDAEGQLVVCDVGHYESEVGTKELLRNYLSEKFPTFATLLSETDTNPVRYFV
jgi:dinuclear metal center YbgI/SA1388 family protein